MRRDNFRKELAEFSDSKKAKVLSSFFKTGKGQYGEGDKFIGVAVPKIRSIANKYWMISFEKIKKLLDSNIHEERLLGVLILVLKYEKTNKIERGKIFKFYLDNAERINNWDLVDLSAPNIVGKYLIENPSLKPILLKMARSKNLWKRRISIVSTFSFIREEKLCTTFQISEILLFDQEDLIHKSVGWMLREAGKRDVEALKCFIRKNYSKIPRTTLRYAIEKFPPKERKEYLEMEK